MHWLIGIVGILGATTLLGTGVAVAAAVPPGQKKYVYWYRWDSQFKAAAGRYGIDWKWIKATAIVESSLGQNPRVLAGGVSEDGKSWGLTQFTLATANDMCPIDVGGKRYTGIGAAELNIPEVSIELAAKYLSQLRKRFPGDTRKAIISYNQGPGNTAKGNDFTGNYFSKWSAALELINEG